ncbi:MFS transporter [Dictyobacter arantiisoli]|uniref:MFS transporter n=1 Tax=Dictyobacter arantiisoli TaxID=2014874 RepID=A0A5A5T8R5_9CHLR|nr:MFS transporter [Dictyobacter arantiisoli]GCF07655.1 MFS transporter [Dictyobacter arantiisoli]
MAIAQPKTGFLTLLKKRDFLRLWLAQLISMTSLNATNYALLILIHNITNSTTLVGLAIICFSIPAVLFGAPAGVFVDRMDKRRVMWGSNCLRAIATILFALILLGNRGSVLFFIYLLTFVISSIGQFFTPAEGSAIPMLVGDNEMLPALSLFNITFMLSQALGYVILAPIALSLLPTFTLFHITFDPIVQLYAACGILYLLCAGLVLLIPPASFAQRHQASSVLTPDLATQTMGIMHNIQGEMKEGWNFIRTRKALLLAVVQLSFAGILILVIGQIATPIVTDLLGVSANLMAVIFAPAGVGLVLGSIIMPGVSMRIGKLRTIFIGILGLTMATLFLPLVTILARWLQPHGWNGNPLLFLAMGFLMFIAGMALVCINIPSQTAMQELTPDWIKGRVLALQIVLYNTCSIPIILFIGALSDILHIDRVLYIMSISILAFGIWSVYYERKNPAPVKAELVEEKVTQG